MDKTSCNSRFQFNRKQESTVRKLVLPFLLASLTGVLLGICLLILFKGQSQTPIIETISAPGKTQAASATYGKAELPGVSLTVWQVGVFSDLSKAEAEQINLGQKGVKVAMRGNDPVHLFAGAALDRKAGSALEAKLQELRIPHFVKDYQIAAISGVIQGVSDGEAKQIEALLNQDVKIAQDLLLGDPEKAKENETRWNGLSNDAKAVEKLLDKAGQHELGDSLHALHQTLGETIAALQENKGVLDVQGRLVQFFVNYESLGSNLIQIR
jgi:hypothetical protein